MKYESEDVLRKEHQKLKVELREAKEQEEKRKAYKIQAQIAFIEQILEAFERLEQLKGFLEVID